MDPNTHMKRVKVMGVSVKVCGALCAKGSLGTDGVAGCGSSTTRSSYHLVNWSWTRMRLVASKRRSWRTPGPCLLIESGAGGRCGRSSAASQQRRGSLEWLAFFLKFSKGCFIERTASRLSDVQGRCCTGLAHEPVTCSTRSTNSETLAQETKASSRYLERSTRAVRCRWTSLHEDR